MSQSTLEVLAIKYTIVRSFKYANQNEVVEDFLYETFPLKIFLIVQLRLFASKWIVEIEVLSCKL